MRRYLSRDCQSLGGRGGLEVKAKIVEQRQWDGQRPPPRQWERNRHPLTNDTALLTDYKLIPDCVMTVCAGVCVHNQIFQDSLEDQPQTEVTLLKVSKSPDRFS